jgi:hypothetical protein
VVVDIQKTDTPFAVEVTRNGLIEGNQKRKVPVLSHTHQHIKIHFYEKTSVTHTRTHIHKHTRSINWILISTKRSTFTVMSFKQTHTHTPPSTHYFNAYVHLKYSLKNEGAYNDTRMCHIYIYIGPSFCAKEELYVKNERENDPWVVSHTHTYVNFVRCFLSLYHAHTHTHTHYKRKVYIVISR